MAGTTPVLDLRRVHYFLALAGSLSFVKTARRLGISQPALSKAIGRFEEELGGKLIRREGRLTHLTQLGAAMRIEFEDLERAAVRSRERARQIVRGTCTQLRVAISPTLGPQRVTDFLETWFRSRSGLELSLCSALPDESAELLLEGRADCAFVNSKRREEPRLRRSFLYSESLAVLHPVNHPFARFDKIGPDLIAMEPMVGRMPHECVEGNDATGIPLDPLARTVSTVPHAVRSDREEWVRALVRSGHGIALVSADSSGGDGLALTPLEQPCRSRDVFFEVATGRTDDHAIRRLADHVHAHDWTPSSMSKSVAIHNRR